MRATTQCDFRAGIDGGLYQFVDVNHRLLIDQRADGNAVVHTVAHGESGGGPDQFFHESVVHAFLHEQAVGADTGLARIAVLGDHRTLDGGIEIGIVKYDEGRVAPQLHRRLFHGGGALGFEHLAHRRRAGEGKFAHQRIGCQLAADGRGTACYYIEDTGGNARALRQLCHGKGGQRCFAGRLDDNGTARRQCRSGLARDHGVGEVPGGDGGDNTHRLLDADDALVGGGAGDDIAVYPLCLFAEPFNEGGTVGNLAPGLRQHLALFGGHENGEVFLVLHHQVEPLAQDAGARLGGLARPLPHGLGRRRYGAGCFGRPHAGHRSNQLTIDRVGDVKGGAVIGIDPLAINVRLVFQ